MQENQNPNTNNPPDTSGDNPSSDFMDDFMNRVQSPSQPAKPVHESAPQNKKLLVLAGVAILSFVLLIVLGAVFNNRSQSSEETSFEELLAPEGEAAASELYDITELSETLNPTLAEAVKKNPNINYLTTLSTTKYSEYTPDQLCEEFSLSCSNLAYPESLARANHEIAMESNALNYHLDQGQIVIISAKGKNAYSADGTVLVVYSAAYDFPIYKVFEPASGDFSDSVYLSRAELFTDIEGLAEFYTISPEAQ